ncbi:hypothetical protein AB5I41_20175 [Sphingomonas sp. MMS24-JH45]
MLLQIAHNELPALRAAAESIGQLMATDTPLDRFKAVLGARTARALSDEAEVELAFTADAPTQW